LALSITQAMTDESAQAQIQAVNTSVVVVIAHSVWQ